jgi:hypothetical protein
MPMSFGGWSVLGIAAAITIAVGIVLLIAYAVQRGLTNRDLGGTFATETATETPQATREQGSGRTLGIVGAVTLVVGLGLGLLAATTGWGVPDSGMGPGERPVDCAQSWSGCPQATPGQVSPTP